MIRSSECQTRWTLGTCSRIVIDQHGLFGTRLLVLRQPRFLLHLFIVANDAVWQTFCGCGVTQLVLKMESRVLIEHSPLMSHTYHFFSVATQRPLAGGDCPRASR